jgi:hypothetical protein
MSANKSEESYSDEEIARRRDAAIRRALSTPPKPLKEFVGKSERAIAQRESRVRKAARSKPKSP